MHYTGDNLRHFALPLGGLGTGTFVLAGNGALRQWQLHNIGNHEGHVPDSFFALRLFMRRSSVAAARRSTTGAHTRRRRTVARTSRWADRWSSRRGADLGISNSA